MYIETKGLGAGSYPEPPEPKCSWYAVNVAVSTFATIYVCADSEEEAEQFVKEGEFEYKDMEIEKYDCVIEEIESVEKAD